MTKRSRSEVLLTGGIVLLAMLASGCAAVAVAGAGVGGYAFHKGKLTVVAEANLQNTWEATLAAAKDLDIREEVVTTGSLVRKFRGSMSDGESVKIDLTSVTADSTEVKIRIGTFGDEVLSNRIYEEINSNL